MTSPTWGPPPPCKQLLRREGVRRAWATSENFKNTTKGTRNSLKGDGPDLVYPTRRYQKSSWARNSYLLAPLTHRYSSNAFFCKAWRKYVLWPFSTLRNITAKSTSISSLSMIFLILIYYFFSFRPQVNNIDALYVCACSVVKKSQSSASYSCMINLKIKEKKITLLFRGNIL